MLKQITMTVPPLIHMLSYSTLKCKVECNNERKKI